MKEFKVGNKTISQKGPFYVIAEIGHNHQGNLKVAIDMIKIAAGYGVDAVKFQKRDNKALYTKAMYEKEYDNEDSFGLTYGEHREFLEFDSDEYVTLKKYAEDNGVEFMCTAFDFESVDFLEKLGINSYKIASGDLTNTPLLEHIAKLNKPIFLSTGAATMKDVRTAYNAITRHNDKLCLLHTTCAYPADYADLHLRVIETLKKEFPDTIVGYSGHDNGILASIIAYMLGAVVVEKHFTMNRAWKGTDHKFSLEPEGLRKQIRDLRRLEQALGSDQKTILDVEKNAKVKMGKSLYTKKELQEGHVLSEGDIVIKSPGGGIEPSHLNELIGERIKMKLSGETMISYGHLKEPNEKIEKFEKNTKK